MIVEGFIRNVNFPMNLKNNKSSTEKCGCHEYSLVGSLKNIFKLFRNFDKFEISDILEFLEQIELLEFIELWVSLMNL